MRSGEDDGLYTRASTQHLLPNPAYPHLNDGSVLQRTIISGRLSRDQKKYRGEYPGIILVSVGPAENCA